MAEFVEVMRTAKRMCESMGDCDVICPLHDMCSDYSWLHAAPAYINENDLAKCEAAIMKWGAENLETAILRGESGSRQQSYPMIGGVNHEQ